MGGLTAGQDIFGRKLQFAATPAHFDLGKSRDTYGPIGPVVVSTDSFANFSEYYADMDSITDDQLWTPGMWEPSFRELYAWGPTFRPQCWSPMTWLI